MTQKNYPFEKEGLTFKHKGKVAVTFCAKSKNSDAEEGTPRELWYTASPRIKSFIDFCERNAIPYAILSYKYGLVASNEVIDNYDIAKQEVDFEEWTTLVSQRAKELKIQEVCHIGTLAFASKEIRSALENTTLKIHWCDDYDELFYNFYEQKTIVEETQLIKDISTYNPRNVSDEVLLDDHRICFTKDTPILTNNGVVFIHEGGESALTHDLEFHSIINVTKRSYQGDMIRVTIGRLGTFEMTPTHPILVVPLTQGVMNNQLYLGSYSGKYHDALGRFTAGTWDRTPIWCEAGHLERNRYAVIVPKPIQQKTQFSKELFALAGWYVAEGFRTYKWVAFSLGKHEQEYAEEIKSLAEYVTDKEIVIKEKQRELQVIIKDNELLNFLTKHFGHGARQKRLPLWVINGEIEKTQAFINSITKGDGWTNGDRFSISTASKRLVYGLFLTLLKLGIIGSISTRIRNNWSKRPLYTISWGKRTRKDYWTDDKVFYFPVRKVETFPFQGYVYNLEVDVTKTYTIPFIVHNTHAWWVLANKGKFKYTKQQIKNLHDAIVEEMKRRGMKHTSPLKEVKDVVKEGLKASGIPFVELAGPEDMNDSELKGMHALAHANKDCTEHDNIVKEMEKRGMTHNSPCEATESKAEDKPEEGGEESNSSSSESSLALEKEARASVEENRIKMFRYFYPLKGIHGYREGEVYKIENLKEFINDDDYPVYVSKKYDGARNLIFKSQNKVKIISEGGVDVTHRLPTIVTLLTKSEWPEEFILDTEIEMWEGEKHFGREETSGFLRRKEPAKPGEDANIVVNVFDCLWFNDDRFKTHDVNATIGDLHNEPFSVRLKYRSLLPFKQSTIDIPEPGLNNVVDVECKDFTELKEAVEKVSKAPASEGAMIKIGESKYPLTGMTQKWIKFKNMIEAHVIVVEQLTTKTDGVFNYKMAISTSPEYDYFKEDIININNKEFIYVGKSFNTDLNLKKGDIITVIFHTLFLYEKDDKIRIRLYEPRIYESRPDDKLPDDVKTVIKIAEKAGVLEKKSRLADPFLAVPPEDKTYAFVYHHHARGSSVHGDLRMEVNDHLVGWTMDEQPEDAIKEDIGTLQDLINLENKIDWKLIKENKHTLAEKKAVMPKDWLSVEGVVEPGEIGATRTKKGVFLIVDKGKVEFGTQKSDFHEYFLDGEKLKGRLVVRQIPVQKKERQSWVWNAWFPDDQLPYVLSQRALKTGYYPPKGFSLLPKKLRNIIPEEYRYWKKDNYKEVRDELIKKIRKGEIKLYSIDNRQYVKQLPNSECPFYQSLTDGYHDLIDLHSQEKLVFLKKGDKFTLRTLPFIMKYHWWKGQKVIREGPTAAHYDIFIGDKIHIQTPNDPFTTTEVSALFNTEPLSLAKKEGEIKPGEPGNPTKNTPSFIETKTKGKVVIYEDSDLFKKIGFVKDDQEVLFIFTRSSVHDEIWTMKETEKAPVASMKLSFDGIEQKGDKYYITGIGLAEGVWNCLYFPRDVIRKSASLLVGKQADIEHNGSLVFGVVTEAKFDDADAHLKVVVETTDTEVVEDIKKGKYRGFSIDAWIEPEIQKGIVKRIIDYDAITITSSPACGICVIGGSK